VGRVQDELPLRVRLDLAGDPVAVLEDDDVGLLGEEGGGGKQRGYRERDEPDPGKRVVEVARRPPRETNRRSVAQFSLP
jgi:hypothetical protein